MKKFLNLVSKSIRKAIGKGIINYMNPIFKKELKYVSNTIKTKFVSSAGKYVIDLRKI